MQVMTVTLSNRFTLRFPSLQTARSGSPLGASAVLLITAGMLITPAVLSHDGELEHDSPSQPANVDAEPTVSEVITQPAAQTMSPVLGGSWSPVYDWPLVAVHAALLPNGKVLSWDATPDDADDDPHTTDNFTTRVTLWDPQDNTHLATNNDTDTDLFCAGSAHLWDGRILFAGGDAGKAKTNAPLSNTNIYDPFTNTWRRAANMNAPRWYSSVAALANGEMLTMGGSFRPELVSEVFQFDRTWRALDNGGPTSLDEWWLQIDEDGTSIAYDYQWIQAAPNGSVISFGPQNLVASLDTKGRGNWTDGPPRDDAPLRDYGSYAMFDVGKILVAGGGNSLATAVIVDTDTQQTTDTSSMNIGRRQHNLTILADGSVLVSGGNTDGARYYSPDAGTRIPELWNAATGQFSPLNPMQGDRQYHSIALLLADGRVLSAGGGICGDCYRLGYEERNAEIFTPPYLYSADASLALRPALQNVPESANYADLIQVSTSADSAIERAHLIKLGSTTHSENQDQRLVPLVLSQSAEQISLTMPASRDVAPPGHYLLFIVDVNGVPSTGGMVKLGQPLVEVGQRIVSTLEPGANDVYAFNLPAGQWVSELSADAAVQLHITREAPDGDLTGSEALCRSDTVGSATQTCSVAVNDAGIWYAAVAGGQRTDYQLDTRTEALVDTGGEPPGSVTSGGSELSDTRVTTGGALSAPFLTFMVIFWAVMGMISRQKALDMR